MTRSPFSHQARQQELAKLRRFLRWSVPGSLIFHGVLAVGLGYVWQLSAEMPPPELEEEIELVAELPSDESADAVIDQSAGGGGGGSTQFDLFNPAPGEGGDVGDAILLAAVVAPAPAATPNSPPEPEP